MSNLSLAEAVESEHTVEATAPGIRRNPVPAATSGASQDRDSLRIVPLSPALSAPISGAGSAVDAEPGSRSNSSGGDAAPLIFPELLEPETKDDADVVEESKSDRSTTDQSAQSTPRELPTHLSSALEELAGFETSAGPRKWPPDRSRQAGAWLLSVLFTATISFTGGYMVAHLQRAATSEAGATDEMFPEEHPAGAVVKKNVESAQSLSGKVMYLEGNAEPKADSGAFVLLVPSSNAAGLRLDAGPLRDLQPSAAKTAIEAALSVLNASVSRADNDGLFTLERRHGGPTKLIVISRHASRPESEPVSPAAAKTLAEWFDSPTQLIGRLRVQQRTVPVLDDSHVAPIEITFGKP